MKQGSSVESKESTDLPATQDKKIEKDRKNNFLVQIDNIESIGSNLLTVRDQSVEPPIDFTLKIDFDVGRMDSTDTSLLTKFSFTGIDQSLRLVLKGSGKPFSPRFPVDIDGTIEGISIPDINPFISQYLGFHVDAGELDGRLRLHLENDRIEGELVMVIKYLETSPANREKLDALEKQMPVSLKKAIKLLRRKDDTIQMTVSVKGNLEGIKSDLKFDLSNALNRGLEDIGSVSVFLLEPFLTPMVQHLIKRGRDLRPVYFEVASTRPTLKGQRHIEKIGNYLVKNTSYSALLCGRAAPRDRMQMSLGNDISRDKEVSSVLHKLARDRVGSIKQIFIDKFHIDKSRLVNCRPIVEHEGTIALGVDDSGYKIPRKDRGKPRVDIYRSK